MLARRASPPDVTGGEGSDDELLRRVGRGDRAAFDEFYERNAAWLAIRIRRRCGDAELTADVLQETFIAVWRAAGSYAGTGQSGGWLWAIATRRLIDAHRRRAVRGVNVGEPDDERAIAPAPSAEDEALAGAYGAELARALDRLSPELRAVLQATVLDGFTVRETALLLDVPEGTVKSRAVRARRQLREALS